MTIKFPDVSHYQQGLSLGGAVAAIAKGSQGASLKDDAYAGFRSQAASLAIPFVGYHWIDQSSPAAQAANAFAVIGHAPLMWDAEATGATVPRIVDLTNRVRAMGGNPRLVYLPHWWWQDHLGSPDLRPLAAAGLSLISSQYTTYSDTGPGWTPYGGMTPVIWQYTDAQLFNGQRVDFNAYKGTVAQLRALLGLTDGGDVSQPAGANADWSVGRGAPKQPGTGDGNEAMTYWAGHVTDRLAALQAGVDELKAAVAALAPGSGGGAVAPHTHQVEPVMSGPVVPTQ